MSNADCTYNTALHIVNKKVKIPSSEVIQMKEEMKKIITNYSNKQKLQVPVKNKGLNYPIKLCSLLCTKKCNRKVINFFK